MIKSVEISSAAICTIIMLKHPCTSLYLTPSSPKSTRHRYAPAFACPSLALYNTGSHVYDSSEAIHDDDTVVGDDDSSVTSLESFTNVSDDDDFWFKKATPQPLAATARVPGTYWEKANVRHPRVAPSMDLKPRPMACYVNSLPSCSDLKGMQHFGNDCLSKVQPTFVVNDASTALDASFSSTDISSAAEVHVVPIATPVSATRVVPCCDLCDRKDAEIQKQLREIEQLKGLVTQLVAVLGQSLTQKLPPTATESQQSPSPPQLSVETQAIESNKGPEAQTPMPLQETSTNSTSTLPSRMELDVKSKGSSQSTAGIASIMEPVDKTKGSSQSTMLRLSRLKQLKGESSPATPRSSRNGKRHVYVSVGGHWGYYCGPALEQNVSLQGCVVRFDNGDLYLGDMICYVPSTSFFSDEHGLRFHGRGALYRKDGTIIRGLFHKHQLIE